VINPLTIRAKVSSGVLKKVDRFFSGSIGDRITELMQNARRAGATRVTITQDIDTKIKGVYGDEDAGLVRIQDNGEGIQDWTKLLDLGASDWHPNIEESEDPAGVGFFCLAPHAVTIRSQGHIAVIEGPAWFGESDVGVVPDPEPITEGTVVTFLDRDWNSNSKKPREIKLRDELVSVGAFGRMKVSYNGVEVEQQPFLPERFIDQVHYYKDLGVKILVVSSENLPKLHCHATGYSRGSRYSRTSGAVFNFYGHLITDGLIGDLELPQPQYNYGGRYGYSSYGAVVLVECTGEKTPLRLVLPQRKTFVQNAAHATLIEAMKREYYRHIHENLVHHTLTYMEYSEAHDLGIDLRESEPVFTSGPLSSSDSRGEDSSEPDVPMNSGSIGGLIVIPTEGPVVQFVDEDGEPLECAENSEYRLDQLNCCCIADDDLNVGHIPFPFRSYSWAKDKPTVTFLEITAHNKLVEDSINGETVTVVERLTFRVELDAPYGEDEETIIEGELDICYSDNDYGPIYLTEEGLDRYRHIRYMTNGFTDDESYEKQDEDTDEDIRRIKSELVGPDEHTRLGILSAIREHVGTASGVCVSSDGESVTIKTPVYEAGSVPRRYRIKKIHPNGHTEESHAELSEPEQEDEC